MPTIPPRSELTDDLLAWYHANARDLPWRRTRDPYAIWVSEVMLQQTQVDTVVPYYHRFLAAFPTVQSLAQAELDQVLGLWQGLGYYRRARSLHAAAVVVVRDHAGVTPLSIEALRALPGVGDYTAGAIASLASGHPAAAVDGNVERVLSRLFALPGDPRNGRPRAILRELAASLVPPDAAGEWNQALMELGATVCLPHPRCDLCPVAGQCAALAAGEPTRYPERAPAPAPRDRLHAAACVVRDGHLLLLQRPPTGRWGGLWELPRVELERDADAVAALTSWLPLALGVRGEVGELAGSLRHAVSGERILLAAYRTTLDGEPRALLHSGIVWAAADLDGVAMPIWQRRLVSSLAW